MFFLSVKSDTFYFLFVIRFISVWFLFSFTAATAAYIYCRVNGISHGIWCDDFYELYFLCHWNWLLVSEKKNECFYFFFLWIVSFAIWKNQNKKCYFFLLTYAGDKLKYVKMLSIEWNMEESFLCFGFEIGEELIFDSLKKCLNWQEVLLFHKVHCGVQSYATMNYLNGRTRWRSERRRKGKMWRRRRKNRRR